MLLGSSSSYQFKFQQKELLRKFDEAMTGKKSSNDNASDKDKGRKKFWK